MAALPFLAQASIVGFLGLLCAAAFSDVHSLTIPNRYSLAIGLLFPVYLLSYGQPVDWLGSLAVGASMLVLGFVLFALRILGGGDAKLMAATALWAGPEQLIDFVLLTALAGGGMVLFLWLRARLSRSASIYSVLVTEVEADFSKQPMPYGVAIGCGGVYVAFSLLGLV